MFPIGVADKSRVHFANAVAIFNPRVDHNGVSFGGGGYSSRTVCGILKGVRIRPSSAKLFSIALLNVSVSTFSISANARTPRPVGGVAWSQTARRLTGESPAVRAAVVRSLARDATLSEKLTRTLTRDATSGIPPTEWFLALDVVSALHLRSLRPLLMREAERDETGYVIHTLNTLADAESFPALAALYRRILERKTAPRAARVSALDSLARFPDPIPVSTLEELLRSPYPELRESTVAYLRSTRNAGGSLDPRDLARLIAIALGDVAPNPRARALFFMDERISRGDEALRSELRRPTVRARLAEKSPVTLSDSEARATLRGVAERLENSIFSGTDSRVDSSLRRFTIRLSDFWDAGKDWIRRHLASPTAPIAPAPDSPPRTLVVSFGYKDARPARFVADRYERLVWIGRIETPCRWGNRQDCGYGIDPNDPEVWRRGNVRIEIYDASAGPDDVANRTDPYQAWKSARAAELFSHALRTADAVFYNGHSRAGGGPDFSSPQVIGPEQEVDYGFYRREEPGFTRLVEDLRQRAAERPQAEASREAWTLGLFSCTSGPHFAKGVKAADPSALLVSSTRLLYFSDALTSTQRALNEWAKGLELRP